MKATGVDIGASGIKIVQVDGTIKKAKVTAFVDHRFDPEATPRLDPESLGRLLEKLFRKHKIKPEGIVASVPAAHCLIREIQVPFTKDEQIRKTIKFQAESAFHSVQIDDMVVEHYKVEEFGNKSRLIVLALKKAIVEARLEAFQAADMDPRFLDIDVMALYNAFMASRAAANNARTMLVDLGAGSLKMCVIEDGRIRAVRSLRANAAGVKVDAGSDGTSRKMPKTLDELRAGLLAEEREDTFFADEGPLPVVILDEDQSELFDFEVEETRQSVLEKIFFEIDRTLVRTILSGPIEQIIVTGGGSKAKGISEAFTQHFEAPCEELPLSSAAAPRLKGSKKADYELVGATALGLALKGIGVDLGGLNLRKEEYQFAGAFDKIKSGIACSLVLMFVLFFLIAYRFQMIETKKLYQKQREIRTQQTRIYREVFSEKPRQGSILSNFRRKKREIKRKLGEDVPDVVSMLDVLRDFALATQKSGRKVKLKTVNLRQRDAVVEVMAEQDKYVFNIKEQMNKGDFLATIEREQITQNEKEGGFLARLNLKLKVDPKAKKTRR